jgi:hypothetical protein
LPIIAKRRIVTSGAQESLERCPRRRPSVIQD